jgi:hypothetical protein
LPFISMDGRRITSLGPFGNVVVRPWRPEDLIATACASVFRNLSHDEWQQYIGDGLPYQAACPNLPLEPEATPAP